MRILVTGSQNFTDLVTMAEVLRPYFGPHGILVSGHADQGADLFAEQLWAGSLGVTPEVAIRFGYIEIHPADWTASCRSTCRSGHRRWKRGRLICPAAGNYRNTEMVALGADICLAFACWCKRKECKRGDEMPHYTHGTQHCAREAVKAGIPVTWTVQEESDGGP